MKKRRFYIAGAQYHDLPSIVKDLSVNMTFDLIPEPENKYDHNAVKIMFHDKFLGYVPRKFSAEISANLEAGAELLCESVEVSTGAKPWEMCKVEISDPDEEEE